MYVEGLAEYAHEWCKKLSTKSDKNLIPKSPIRAMFTSFKEFYTELACLVRDVTYISGRHAFLHRARVARENEDVASFRELRNELIQYWYAYLEREGRKKRGMERKLAGMLEADVYPSHEWDGGKTSLNGETSNDTKRRQIRLIDEGAPDELHQILNRCSSKFSEELDVGCVAQLGGKEWCGEPGPSNRMKKRRVNSGFSEMTVEGSSPSTVGDGGEEVAYVGKGKGRMGAAEVIYID